MFKVECPGCKASYNVDERRVPPAAGMKMRCPKCTTTFHVKRPEDAAAETKNPPDAPAAPPNKVRKATVMGLGGLTPGLPGAPTPLGDRSTTAAPSGDEDLLPAVLPHNRPAPTAQGQAPSPADVARGKQTAPLDELDLPAIHAPLPAARPGPPGARAQTVNPFADLDDLPSPAAAGLPSPAADLPSLAGGQRGSKAPAAKGGRQITGGVLFEDVDLPSPAAELPVVRGGASSFDLDLPAPRGAADLPAVRGGGAELPAPRGALDLPSLHESPRAAAPPPPASGGFGELDLEFGGAPEGKPRKPSAPPPSLDGDPFALAPPSLEAPRPLKADPLPSPSAKPPAREPGLGAPRAPSIHGAQPFSGFGDAGDDDPFASPPVKSGGPAPAFAAASAPPAAPFNAAPEAPKRTAERTAGGGTDFDFGGDDGPAFGAVSEPPPKPAAAAPAPAAAKAAPGPSMGWGERDLGGGDDEMEFDAIPQEKEKESSVEPAPSGTLATTEKAAGAEGAGKVRPPPAPTTPKTKIFTLRRLGVAMLVVLAGGVGLQFTPAGLFGKNFIFDTIYAKDYETLRQETLSRLRESFAKDTASAATQALQLAEANHNKMPRATAVAALAAYAAYLKEIRFGHDSAQHARANTILSTIPADTTPVGYELAKASQSTASDQFARGQSVIEAFLRKNPGDVDAAGLAGEIAIAAKDAERAVAHWTKLAESSPSPRSSFGLARAQLLKKDNLAAKDAAKKAIEQEPKHVGATLMLAQLAWNEQDETTAIKLIEKLQKEVIPAGEASKEEQVAIHALMGTIHLRRSRVSAAEAAFNEALKLNPKTAVALNGMGEALYRAGRYAEALARFSSSMEADPEAVEPKVGVAKTKLALEKLQEAKELLRGVSKKLKDENRPSSHVLHWQGRISESLGDKNAAEADYNEAIKIANNGGDIVDTYVALAQLLFSQGRSAEAQSKLDEAKAKLPKSVTLFKALGDMSSQAGRYNEAEAHYQNALQLDPLDISTRFRLGITLRRLAKFDVASEALDKVSEADKDFPGLALERAVLYEASGQSSKAVELYEAALAKAPNDPDLMLRVAAALLAVNQPAQLNRAEELLRKVMQLRQNSAEANHFLGRALLMKGTNLAEALRNLRRATDLDPNRAEFYLYVGWAANEADDQTLAGNSLAKALDLDKSLADAYWQRGVLRRRQRNVTEAEQDLLKALELRPSRFEAHATLAEVYEDQQKWGPAQTSWQKAITADGKRAAWRFRLGKLLTQHGNRASALEHLSQAVQIASQATSLPPWLAEACLLLADAERAANKKELAIEHYQRFLSLSPPESPYRADAQKALKALGANSP